MTEMILPGTYIEVRPEALIAPGAITVGNIGVVGTASKGSLDTPVLLGSYAEAQQHFYAYDSFIDPDTGKTRVNSLTLLRAIELLFGFGATTVYAQRVAASGAAKAATYTVASSSGDCVTLTASSEGTWANEGLAINVAAAQDDAYVEHEKHKGSETPPTLLHKPKQSARNRVTLHVDATGTDHPLQVGYDGGAAPTPGQVQIDRASGKLTFGDAVAPADSIDVSYVVDAAQAVLVTLRLDRQQALYTVVDGNDLAAQLKGSAWVSAAPAANAKELPKKLPDPPPGQLPIFAAFKGGSNGEAAAASDYNSGLDKLLDQPVQIVVAAGQDDSFGNDLDRHCQKASTDAVKRDRIGVVGPKAADPNNTDAYFDAVIGHNLSSDRIIFTAPGILTADSASGRNATLPGAYTAAAFAGFLSSLPAHVSSTNKVLDADDVEIAFDNAHLTQLVENRVLALEKRQGIHVVKGITTDPGAFRQITTRRIVDYAKYGIRSAADPYIGLLNNDRVRGALRATLNGFLTGMINDEMLESYELNVTATRAEEIQGIVNVTMTLQPVFSIDFIKVTMFLQ